MNAIKELQSTTHMSQNKFATYLGIPVANIQHWEQGVTNPPNYLVSLISRVMKHDGYIDADLSPSDVDAIRQVQATLAIEGLSLTPRALADMQDMVKGKISREQFREILRQRYLNHEPL